MQRVCVLGRASAGSEPFMTPFPFPAKPTVFAFTSISMPMVGYIFKFHFAHIYLKYIICKEWYRLIVKRWRVVRNLFKSLNKISVKIRVLTRGSGLCTWVSDVFVPVSHYAAFCNSSLTKSNQVFSENVCFFCDQNGLIMSHCCILYKITSHICCVGSLHLVRL